MTVRSGGELFCQTSYIGYYFHWPEDDILDLPHIDRERYMKEISKINRKVNGGGGNLFEI